MAADRSNAAALLLLLLATTISTLSSCDASRAAIAAPLPSSCDTEFPPLWVCEVTKEQPCNDAGCKWHCDGAYGGPGKSNHRCCLGYTPNMCCCHSLPPPTQG